MQDGAKMSVTETIDSMFEPAIGMRIGIDIAEESDLDGLLQNERAMSQVFTEREIADCRNRHQDTATAFMRRFAAKEAVAKAVGTIPGHFAEIEITHDDTGRPQVGWKHLTDNRLSADISLSSTGSTAVAIALVLPDKS
jgi:phosphopantetheine--protein transferase-like protein